MGVERQADGTYVSVAAARPARHREPVKVTPAAVAAARDAAGMALVAVGIGILTSIGWAVLVAGVGCLMWGVRE